jgi:hypothetical protein
MTEREVEVFRNDDEAYRSWLARNREGYVINTYARPDANYLVLHRSDCHHIDITRGDAGRRWTYDYIKVCSASESHLERWADDQVGGVPRRCPTCAP